MPFVPYNLLPVVRALRRVAAPRRLICLSCPDLIMSRQSLGELIPEAEKLPAREDTEGILQWHKSTQFRDDGVVDTWDAFAAMDTEMVAFDIYRGRGREEVCDLNEGIPNGYQDHAHVVFDCITNQVARPFNSLMAAIDVLAVGGTYVGCLPVKLVNQGYFNMCPSFFNDVFEVNGMKMVSMDLVEGVYTEYSRMTAEPVKRMRDISIDTMLLVEAVKTNRCPPTVPSLMTKFRSVQDCKIVKQTPPHLIITGRIRHEHYSGDARYEAG